MAVINKLTLRFEVDVTATNVLYFEVFNRGTAVTTSYTYTFVDLDRDINECLTGTFGVTGEGSAINYKDALEIDYGSSIEFSIVRTANVIVLTGDSSDIFFQNAAYNGVTKPTDVKIKYSSESVDPEPTTTAYYLEFKDVKDIQHRVNIYKPNTTPEYTQVEGDCTLESQDDEDTQTPLRPQQLNVNLLANTSLTFEDLYTEEERVWKVEYIRNSVTEFVGWLSSDGLYESFVDEKWYINLSAIDGLGYLKDIAYTNADRLNYAGKQSFIEIITNCLAKTNLDLGFRTAINVYYEGLSGVDVLSNIYANSERFVNDNDEEALSCEEVLKSALELFNATLLQNGGYWYIYRTIEAQDNANITFYNYDKDGVLVSGTETIAKDISASLGSQIDAYYPHHANANQQKSIKRSLGAYRVNLKYGRVFPYYDNTNLVWTNSTSIPEWTISGSGEITQAYPNRGFLIYRPDSSIDIQATLNDYTVSGDPRIQTIITFTNPLPDSGIGSQNVDLAFKLVYYKGANYYYCNANGVWESGGNDPENDGVLILQGSKPKSNQNSYTLTTDVVPESDGNVFIVIFNPGNAGPIIIDKVVVQTYTGPESPQGLNYTIEKASNYTPNTDEVKKVLNGDIVDESYYATIYKNDQTTPTDNWYRSGVTELKDLLRIMVEDRIRMAWNPRYIFEGDVYGFISLFSVININNVKTKMLPVQWFYDCKNNITSIKSVELLNYDFTDDDVLFSLTEDYGETVKPKIKT